MAIFWVGCASSPSSSSVNKREIKIDSKENIYFSLTPFDSSLNQSLTQRGLEPLELKENIQKEVRYQLYLKNQKVIDDEKKSDVQILLRINEIVEESTSGNQIKAKLSAYRKGYREEMDIDFSSKAADDSAPESFLTLNLPRIITGEVLKRLKLSTRSKEKPKKSAVPQVLIVF